MMSHFHGCNNLMTIIFLMFIFFFSFLGTSVVAGRENPLVELSSREDLVQMAGYGEEKLSTVLVSGTVLCSDEKAQNHPHPVSGASVAVLCHTSGNWKTRKSNWARGTTDEYGDFLIDLPSHLHSSPNLEKICLVKVLQLPRNSLCRPAFTGDHKGVELSSVGNGIRTYTAQRIHLKCKPSKAITKTSGRKEKMLYAY
ncbi:hypothetical protein F0562_013479 [Nyssa sinensis]|uniref:Pollen Ole e 1 allergen and extensin family protein n=1 Tax=Nyssa sinensis TaxID=561372 RepID=A0A5J4ZKC3_9ASTE|nr:hypothetical protein F0562_013479 [Nyssa sinensis]